MPLTEYTYDQIADQLTDGYWDNTFRATRAFAVAPGGSLDVNITALTASGKSLATSALQAWTYVTGISFNFITTAADITFDDADSGAYSVSNVSGNTITSSSVNVSTAWLTAYGTTLDTYSFQTYIHEIGHALGLGHAGNYNGSATYGIDNNYLNDSWQASVMSYFDQIDNTYITASYAYIVTPMIADIIAIHNLYGSGSNQRTGNTVYGENSTAGGYYDSIAGLTGPVAFTILDDGGTDTIDFSSVTDDQRIDLNQEAISNVNGLIGNMIIARGSVIENALSGSGDDILIGNSAANGLSGGGGDDTITGGAGDDTITGGSGSDTITDLIANFFGDTITDFSTEDQFVFQGLEIGRGNISVASGPTVLSVDSDKDTTPDGSFTLTGDFSGGDFMAVVTAGDTVVTYETFLPGLSETVSVDAADINGIDNQAFLTGTGAVDFRVTLDASAVSGYNNVLGVYEIDGTGALVDVRLLAEDIHAAPSFSTLITGVEAGNALGFFIVQNGAAWAASLGGGVAFSFVNTANDAANLSDGSDLKLAVDNVATDKVVFHSYDLTMNADTVQHVLSGVVTGGLSIEIGFEDMTGGGDLDYQDVVFTVDLV